MIYVLQDLQCTMFSNGFLFKQVRVIALIAQIIELKFWVHDDNSPDADVIFIHARKYGLETKRVS